MFLFRNIIVPEVDSFLFHLFMNHFVMKLCFRFTLDIVLEIIANNKSIMLEDLLTCDPSIANIRNDLNYTLLHCATWHKVGPCAEVLLRFAPHLKYALHSHNETVAQRLNRTKSMRLLDERVRNR